MTFKIIQKIEPEYNAYSIIIMYDDFNAVFYFNKGIYDFFDSGNPDASLSRDVGLETLADACSKGETTLDALSLALDYSTFPPEYPMPPAYSQTNFKDFVADLVLVTQTKKDANEALRRLIQRTLSFANAGAIPGFTGKLMGEAEYDATSQRLFVDLALKDKRLREEALALVGDKVPTWLQVLNSRPSK